MPGPDPKQGKRIIDPEAIEAKMMGELRCRACFYGGPDDAHHLVLKGRTSTGDDVQDNIIGLCKPCHGSFHAKNREGESVARRIRSNLTAMERMYILKKKGQDYLDVNYPRYSGSAESPLREDGGANPFSPVSSADKPEGVEQPAGSGAAPPSGAGLDPEFQSMADAIAEGISIASPEMLSEGDSVASDSAGASDGRSGPERVATPSESIPTVTPYWLEPGADCPTCHRKIPHKKKETTPRARTWGFKIPEDEREAFETNLENVEKIIGAYGRPYAHFQTVVAMLGYILMNHEDEFRRFLSA